mmetsp:Transcript_57772/g.93520  ORF Transcript_57772/g.93520 Transcript_57772/m.93520 type:complete len:110 (-) Transcript_57772:14-343(-)
MLNGQMAGMKISQKPILTKKVIKRRKKARLNWNRRGKGKGKSNLTSSLHFHCRGMKDNCSCCLIHPGVYKIHTSGIQKDGQSISSRGKDCALEEEHTTLKESDHLILWK